MPFLPKGGIVAGVQFDGNLTAEFALDRLLQSGIVSVLKYVQAWNPGIFQRNRGTSGEGTDRLFYRKSLYCPGLYAFLGKDDPNLITADFICHGVPSPAVVPEYKEASGEAVRRENDFPCIPG